MVPVLILDTTNRPDIDDMIAAHKHGGQGDVRSVWGTPSRWRKESLQLVLTVVNPSQCVVVLEFHLPRQWGVVDQIVQTELLYLQGGRPGDRLASTFDAGRVIMEIPCGDFRGEWEEVFREVLVKEFRNGGLRKWEARERAGQFMGEWRAMGSQRIAQ